jgi:hypothetical protein
MLGQFKFWILALTGQNRPSKPYFIVSLPSPLQSNYESVIIDIHSAGERRRLRLEPTLLFVISAGSEIVDRGQKPFNINKK